MMRCTIHLENNDCVYAGQMLKGTIKIILKEPKKIRSLYFIVNGRAKCSWSEHEKEYHHREGSRILYFEGEEIFMKQRTYLLGAEVASFLEWDTTEVACGTHRYELAFQLPEKLPASYEGKHGSIRYSVEAVLDVPLGYDKKIEEKFTVHRKDDLNLQPELGMPCKSEEIKSFCSLFCKSGPLKMEATIPMSGFGPGQIISVTVSFDNRSKVHCDRTKISLNRIIRYNSTTPHQHTKIEAERLVKVIGQGISAGSSTTFTQELEIPRELLSSNNKYCNAVQITYELQVEGKIKGCHRNVEILFPIIIGSVAISSNRAKPNQANTDQAKTSQAPHIDSFETGPMASHIDRIFGPKITQNEVFIVSSPVDFTAPMDENNLPPKGRINRW